MKSYNHLMEKYLSRDNYRLGVKNATQHKNGKKHKYKTAKYYKTHVEELEPEILEYAEHFKNEEHEPKVINDGITHKKRTIIVPSMKEQIIHHMIINILKPIFMRTMYEHSYGSIPGRGALASKKKKNHSGKTTIEKWIKTDSINTKYVLKMDIKKYFESIPHSILREKLAKLIHDKKFLNILYEIVDASGTDKGIPIGFYTSQWLANWYLTELDHYIKEELHAVYYIRYMDDMVIFGASKEELHIMRKKIEIYLNNKLGLQMKANWQVFPLTSRALDFMGFRFFPNRIILRKTIMLKLTRKVKHISKKQPTIHDYRQIMSYNGWLQNTNTYLMKEKYIAPYIKFSIINYKISRYQRRMN